MLRFHQAVETRIAVGGAVSGWRSLEDAGQESARYVPDGPTRPRDPLLLYFTSGTTSRPKLVKHSPESHPVWSENSNFPRRPVAGLSNERGPSQQHTTRMCQGIRRSLGCMHVRRFVRHPESLSPHRLPFGTYAAAR